MSFKKGMTAGLVALGSAAAGATSAAVNYAGNKSLQEDAQLFNAAEAQKSRDYDEYMSNTSYQRAVADAYAAGINIGSIGGSGGASTPQAYNATSGMNHFNSGMDNMFNSAVARAVATDKKVYKKVVGEMKTQSAYQIADLRKAGKAAIKEESGISDEQMKLVRDLYDRL